jgi:predicted ester cyclase
VVDGEGVKVEVDIVSNAAVIRFMEYFFGELLDSKVRENWRRYDEYFSVLKDFS